MIIWFKIILNQVNMGIDTFWKTRSSSPGYQFDLQNATDVAVQFSHRRIVHISQAFSLVFLNITEGFWQLSNHFNSLQELFSDQLRELLRRNEVSWRQLKTFPGGRFAIACPCSRRVFSCKWDLKTWTLFRNASEGTTINFTFCYHNFRHKQIFMEKRRFL